MSDYKKTQRYALFAAGLGFILSVAAVRQFAQSDPRIAKPGTESAMTIGADSLADSSNSNPRYTGGQETNSAGAPANLLLDGKGIRDPGDATEIITIGSDAELSVSTLNVDRPTHARYVSAVNDAMDRELEADEIAEDFGARMEGLFRDKGADEMVRNFAVQHLERFAQERTIRGTWDVDSDEAAKVRAALEDAALEVDNSIGGTAMLALARLSEIDPHVDRRRLSSRSASLVASPSARLSSRIAAAQLCGLLRVRSALPALLSLSADSSVPTPLRLAAAHAAGLVFESR